jgi:hypothetical protein
MVDQNKAEENPIEDIQVLGKVALLVRTYLITSTKGGLASAKVLAY